MRNERDSRSTQSGGPGLHEVRGEIDEIDAALVALIRDRVRLAVAAADSKAGRGEALRDVAREAEVIRRAAERARMLGIDGESVRDVFWRLIDLSHRSVASREAQ